MRTLYFCPVVCFFLSFFPLLILAVADWMSSILRHMRIKNACLKCAARGLLQMRDAKNRHLHTITQLCRDISSQLRYVSTIGKKNLLNSNISSTCLYNMVNFGPLAAEICWRVWGSPTNFNGFRVLAVLLQGTLVVSIIHTAALNRDRHLYSAGRPSPWALAHISS